MKHTAPHLGNDKEGQKENSKSRWHEGRANHYWNTHKPVGRPQEMTILFLFGLIIIVMFFNVPALLYVFWTLDTATLLTIWHGQGYTRFWQTKYLLRNVIRQALKRYSYSYMDYNEMRWVDMRWNILALQVLVSYHTHVQIYFVFILDSRGAVLHKYCDYLKIN